MWMDVSIVVDRPQLMTEHAAGVRGELCDQFITACNGKPPWLSEQFPRTVLKIKQHDFLSTGIW